MQDGDDDTTIGAGGWALVALAASVSFAVLHFLLGYHFFPAGAFAAAIALIVLLILYRLAQAVNRYDDAEASRQVRKIVPASSGAEGGVRVSGIEGAQSSPVVAVPVRPEMRSAPGMTPLRPSAVVTPLAKLEAAPILPPQPVVPAAPPAAAKAPAPVAASVPAAMPKAEAKPKVGAAPKAEAAPTVEPKPKAAPTPKAEAKPMVQGKPKAEFRSKADFEDDGSSALKAVPLFEQKPKTAAKPKPKAEVKPQAEVKLKAEDKPKTEVKPKAEVSPKAEPKPKPKAAAKPTATAKATPVAKPKEAEPKPAGLVRLAAPRGGKADDLKLIDGVGPALEKLVNSLGFYHFDQIAAWNAADVALVDAELKSFKGRVTRDKWVVQAKILAKGGSVEEAAAAAAKA
jgi:predicted flap endonuclease-1-like 5' DNA nuclease